MSRTIKVHFLGKSLGQASGWDGDPDECWWFYDFKPNPDCELPACSCLQFDVVNALIHTQDNEGNELETYSISWGITKM